MSSLKIVSVEDKPRDGNMIFVLSPLRAVRRRRRGHVVSLPTAVPAESDSLVVTVVKLGGTLPLVTYNTV